MRIALLFLGWAAAAVQAAPWTGAEPLERQAAKPYWYETIKHNGVNPVVANPKNWTVFRNVRDYGAKGDGTTDDTAAIQKAINYPDRGGSKYGTTGAPAVIYFPPGTYLVNSGFRNYVSTSWIGDPTNRPVLKAGPSFTGAVMINGADPTYGSLVGFYQEFKNLILDSTAVAPTKAITLITWGTSEATQLSNVLFNMPVGATAHTGIGQSGTNQPLYLNDLTFIGGGTGLIAAALQFHFKNFVFKNTVTGIKSQTLSSATAQGFRFEGVTTGIDVTTGSSFLALIDSTAVDTNTVLTLGTGAAVVENLIAESGVKTVVKVGGQAAVTSSILPGQTWIKGSVYTAEATTPSSSTGKIYNTTRPSVLVNSTGFYHQVVQPTYAEYDISQVVNVRDVAAYPVAADGTTDDTASLQAILNDAAAKNMVAYFPHGIYILKDTLTVPVGSRLFGEAWAQFAAMGPKFADAKNPRPMVKVGNPGDVGVAQFHDFLFTVGDVLPGAIMLQVHMAGAKPGDVGFWNVHSRVGGAKGSKTQQCRNVKACNAAHINFHLAPTSSSYWENSWLWSADHDIDGGGGGQPSDGGGIFVEATKGTWFHGIGIEHHGLYQMAYYRASNVFSGLQQGESAPYEGPSSTLPAPQPWGDVLLPGEPDYSWCGASDNKCRVSAFQYITDSSNLNLYGNGFWDFPNSQTNAVVYKNNTKMYTYGLTVLQSQNMILESGVRSSSNLALTAAANSPAMAAYLRMSG